MSGQEILSKCRGLALTLKNINIETLVAMRCVKAFQDAERYDGIVKDFKDSTSSSLDSLTLQNLSRQVQEADARQEYLNPSASKPPSALRGTKKPAAKSPSPAPVPGPSPAPTPPPNMAVQYPSVVLNGALSKIFSTQAASVPFVTVWTRFTSQLVVLA